MEFLRLVGLVALLVATLATGLGRVYRPWVAKPTAPMVQRFRLSLRERLRLHAPWVALAGAPTVVGTAAGWLPSWFGAALLGWLALLLSIPMRYTVTRQGIALGRTPPRRWTEFCGLWSRPGRLYLQPVAGVAGMDIWTRDPAAVTELRARVRGSYKGERFAPVTVEAEPASLGDLRPA